MSNSISSCDSRNMDLLSEVASAAKSESDGKKLKTTSKHAKQLPLPVTLMKLLNDETAPDAIWWLPGSDDEFAINSELFASQVLGVHLPAAKYSAFMRRLRKWGFTKHSTKYLKKLYKNQIPPKTVSFCHRQSLFDKKRPELLHQMKGCTAAGDNKAVEKKVRVTKAKKKSKVAGPSPTVAMSSLVPFAAVKAEVTPKTVPSTIITEQGHVSSGDLMDDATATNLLMQFGAHTNNVPKFPLSDHMHGHHSLESIDMATFSILLRQEQLRQLQEQQARLQEEENERQVYAYLMQKQQEEEEQRQRLMEALLVQEQQNRLQQHLSGITGNYHQNQDDLLMLQLLQQQQQTLNYQNGPDGGRFY